MEFVSGNAQPVPFLNACVAKRWRAWEKTAIGRMGATIVEAEMDEWSGVVPPALETVVHVLLPGPRPIVATRDIGDGRRETLTRTGQICVTPAGCTGHWEWSGSGFRDLNLVMPHSLLRAASEDAGLADVPDLMPLARGPRSNALIEQVVHYLGEVGAGRMPATAAEVDHLIGFVACWLMKEAEPEFGPKPSGLSVRALRRVLGFIDENLERDLSLTEMARLVGLSAPYFSHAFRTAVGEPPYRYLLRRRCERACTLMEGPTSIAEIALAVGFSSQSHFTTAFRRLMGTTPAAWRRARRA
ncbi:MAG: helix-turn-helix transcriptional regulator [Methylobacteriaceae bacterium]|nr:helix-turn-helix transcriptional regulator [Methylobacteriaceae bacterium]